MSKLSTIIKSDLYWNKVRLFCDHVTEYINNYEINNYSKKAEHIVLYNQAIMRFIKNKKIVINEIHNDPEKDLLEKTRILRSYAVQKCL